LNTNQHITIGILLKERYRFNIQLCDIRY